jgi:hypothetical protein
MDSSAHVICVGCRLTIDTQAPAARPVLDPQAFHSSLPRPCCWCGDEVSEYQSGVGASHELSCLGMHVPETVDGLFEAFRRAG